MKILNNPVIQDLKKILLKFKDFTQIRLVRLFVQVIILLIAIIYLYVNIKSIQTYQFNFEILPVVVVFFSTLIAILIGTVTWWITLSILGYTVPWVEAAGIHLKSNLAKYIPGYGWQLFGKVYLTTQIGISLKNAGYSLLLELAAILYYDFILAVILLPKIFIESLVGPQLASIAQIAMQIMGGVLAITFPIITNRIIEHWRPSHAGQNSRIKQIYLLSSIMLLTWLYNGVCFTYLARAFYPISLSMSGLLIFTLTLSFLIGFLVFIVPGSIGVREGVIVYLLSPLMGGPIAVILAVTYRIILTLSEIVGLLVYLVIKKISIKVTAR